MSQPKNNGSFALAYSVHKAASKTSRKASPVVPTEAKTTPASSLAEAILNKRKAKIEEPVDLESAEDPAIDAYDLLEDTDEVPEDIEPPKALVDRIRARMKARRGV